MSDNSSGGSNSFAMFINMLQLLFIGLKLTNNIDWSWWWVLSPIWIQIIIGTLLWIQIIIGTLLICLLVFIGKIRGK